MAFRQSLPSSDLGLNGWTAKETSDENLVWWWTSIDLEALRREWKTLGSAVSRKESLIGHLWSYVFTVARGIICPPCMGWREYRAYQCCPNHVDWGGDGGLWWVWFPKENSDEVNRGRKNRCLCKMHRCPVQLPHGNRIIHQLTVLAWHSSSQGWNPISTINKLCDHDCVTSLVSLSLNVPIYKMGVMVQHCGLEPVGKHRAEAPGRHQHVSLQLGVAWSLKSVMQQISFWVFNQRKWKC